MFDRSLNHISRRLNLTITRNQLLQKALDDLHKDLKVTRVALYYFYREWRGQVITESLSHPSFSILGSTGADDCFNGEYAQLYLDGRVCCIDDVQQSNLEACHLEFLQSIQVQANLVVPVIVQEKLWGLLAAHHNEVLHWSEEQINLVREQAHMLERSPVLNNF